MNKPIAVFRVDGSNRIGTGHIFRCLSLAIAFERRNVQPLFLTKDHEPRIQALIEQRHFPIQTIHHTLGVEEDASLTVSFLNRKNATFLITDVAHLENISGPENYEHYCMQVLANTQTFSISLDDLFLSDLPFDIRIIPYCGARERNYQTKGKTKLLLGPAYFIFQDDFVQAPRKERVPRRQVTNILVTMGGSDPHNMTVRVVESLMAITKRPLLDMRVVIGPGFSSHLEREILDKLYFFGGKYKIISGAAGIMERLMLWADLVITAGGLTKYEAAVTGTPSVVIAPFDREVEMCRTFADAGASLCFNLRKINIERDLPAIVEMMLDNYELRREMSRKGKELVDGKGVERIFIEIPNGLFS